MRHRHVAAAVTGLAIAAVTGLIVGTFWPGEFWLHAVVFAACMLGPAYGVGWIAFVSPAVPSTAPARLEDTVEHDWWQRSTSASLLDVLAAAGLGTFVLTVTRVEPSAPAALSVLIAFAFADVAVRLLVLRRRAG